MSELSDAKFYIDDSGGLTVSEIRRKCRKLKNSEEQRKLLRMLKYLGEKSRIFEEQIVEEIGLPKKEYPIIKVDDEINSK